METYYTKKEYNEMKNSLTKKYKLLQNKYTKLEKKFVELQEDYDNLLTTATESRN